MAGSKVEAATLINKVIYQTDRASMKKVRKEMRDLQNLMNKLRGTSSGRGNGGGGRRGAAGGGSSGGSSSPNAEARRKIKEAREEVRRVAKARLQAEKESAQRAKKAQQEINKRLSGGRLGGTPTSAAESAKAFEQDFKKQEKARMEAYNRSMLEQQRQVDAQRKQILKERTAQEKRDKVSNRVSKQFAFDIGRLNLKPKQIEDAARRMEELNKAYRNGHSDIADFRQESRQLLKTFRDQSSAAKTLKERLQDLRKGGSAGLGLGGKALGLGVLGAVGAGYMGANAARNGLNTGVQTSRGLSRVNAMGVSSEEAQALQLASLRGPGLELSYEKISDIAKDVRDKVGQLSLGSWKQEKKSGDWNFSGGGELGDLVKIMTTRAGYGRDEAIKTIQSVKGPTELALLLQRVGKQAKLTQQETENLGTALSEGINDFTYIINALGPNASEFNRALKDLATNGFLVTEKEKENLKQLSDMSATYDAANTVFSSKFSSSFVDGLKQAGIDSGNLGKELAGLSPIVKELGSFVGETTGRFIKLLDWLPGGEHKQVSDNGLYYKDSHVGSAVSWYQDTFGGIDDFIGKMFSPTMASPNSIYGMNSGSFYNPYLQSPVTKSPTEIKMTIQIDPNSGEFSRAFSAQAMDIYHNGLDDLSFDIDNMTSYN
jgi:hypothetical protein